MAAEEPQPAVPRKRHSVRRWVLRILLGVVALLVLVAIVVQIVLLTSFPKSMVVSQVEKGLGLRMGVSGLSTGWLGHTSMSGVKLSLPLDDQAFFDVPAMKVRHTNLLGLILGWDIQIKAVELQDAVLYVRQDVAGRWNLQQAAELLARAVGKKTGQQTAQTSTTPALPWVKIENLTVVVLDNQNRQAKIAPINVRGQPETPVSWKYDVEIPSGRGDLPPHLSLLGRLAPGGTWAHQATIWINDIAPWARPWKPGFNQPITFNGKWSGELATAGVSGFLQIISSQFGATHADGALSAAQNGGVVTVSPDNLHLISGAPDPKSKPIELRIPAGQLSYDGKVFHATRVQLTLLGGPATFSGWFEPDIRQGALEAVWENLTVPATDVKHNGKMNATFHAPVAAPMTARVELNLNGTTAQGPFDAVVTVDANGQSAQTLTWHLDGKQLAWHRPQPIVLNGLTADGTWQQSAQHKVLALTRVSFPADNRLAGRASYDFVPMQGTVHIQGQDWPIHVVQGTNLAFALDADEHSVTQTDEKGTHSGYFLDLHRFELRSGDAMLGVAGTYDSLQPRPVKAEVAFVNTPGAQTQAGRSDLIRGYLSGNAKLAGVLLPHTDIAIDGSLVGRDGVILGHPVGDMQTAVHGSINDEQVVLEAAGIPFLGGVWGLGAHYVMQKQGQPVYVTTVGLDVQQLPLNRLSDFLKVQQVGGIFHGHWDVQFPGLKPDRDRIVVNGSGEVSDLAASYLVADRFTFTTTLVDGIFRMEPIQLHRGNFGSIDASANLDLHNWRQIHAGIEFAAWPIEIPNAELTLLLYQGAKQIDVMLPNASAQDPAARKLRVNSEIDLRTRVLIRDQPEGELRVLLATAGRSVNLRQLRGDLLGGTVNASGTTDMDAPTRVSTAAAEWNGLQSDRLVRLYPQLKGFGGTLNGYAHLQPANWTRALEPLVFNAYLLPDKAHWRTVNVGNGEIHAYIGPHRIIASNYQKTTFRIGGGDLDAWFSSSSHFDTAPSATGQDVYTGNITISNQLNLTLRKLKIDPFVSAFDPGHAPGFGQLSGSVFLLSAPKTKSFATTAAQSAPKPVLVATTVPSTTLPAPTTLPSSTQSATTQPATTGPATAFSATMPTTAPLPTTQLAAIAPASRSAATTTAASQPAGPSLMQQLLRTTTVDGSLELENSDLGNFGPVSFLYNAMHLGGNARKPTGRGNVSLHMEAGKLHVTNLYYFNRGIEVRGVATVDQMWDLPRNPMHGTAAGSARPLKNVHLPLIAEADAIIGALEGQLTAVEFAGSVREPTKSYIRLLGAREMGGEIRALILGTFGTGSGE